MSATFINRFGSDGSTKSTMRNKIGGMTISSHSNGTFAATTTSGPFKTKTDSSGIIYSSMKGPVSTTYTYMNRKSPSLKTF